MWITIDTSLPHHPKLARLAARLGVNKAAALGHLVAFWSWVMQFAPSGVLATFEAAEIADGALWSGEPDVFLAALCAAGLVDRTEHDELLVHDWEYHGGRLFAARQAARERMRRARSGEPDAERSTNVRRTFGERSTNVPRTFDILAKRSEAKRSEAKRSEASEASGASGAERSEASGASGAKRQYRRLGASPSASLEASRPDEAPSRPVPPVCDGGIVAHAPGEKTPAAFDAAVRSVVSLFEQRLAADCLDYRPALERLQAVVQAFGLGALFHPGFFPICQRIQEAVWDHQTCEWKTGKACDPATCTRPECRSGEWRYLRCHPACDTPMCDHCIVLWHLYEAHALSTQLSGPRGWRRLPTVEEVFEASASVVAQLWDKLWKVFGGAPDPAVVYGRHYEMETLFDWSYALLHCADDMLPEPPPEVFAPVGDLARVFENYVAFLTTRAAAENAA